MFFQRGLSNHSNEDILPPHESIFFSGADLKKIKDCVGDPHADAENPVLKAEQDAQVSSLKCKLFLVLFSLPFPFI